MEIHRPSDRTLIGRSFFEKDPVSCARGLVGARLVWGAFEAVVVETEAYDAEGDAACHTFFRPAARAFVESHQAGAAYVYLNYGMHWMLNALVKGQRTGFVLIRALEPVVGIDAMKKARGLDALQALCSGPGKLSRALGITGADHGKDLCTDPRQGFHAGAPGKISTSPRIGISRDKERLWRFYATGNTHVSRAPSPGRKK